jgi:hypothetical protein
MLFEAVFLVGRQFAVIIKRNEFDDRFAVH